jgi:hypothetical protein
MNSSDQTLPPATGPRVAAIYALVAHRLAAFYDHGHWITEAQALALCADWLQRAQHVLPLAERRVLALVSEDVTAQIRDTLSREAGLWAAHELMESLDPRYESEFGASIMAECVRRLDEERA